MYIFPIYTPSHLSVDVAERTTEGMAHVPDRHRWGTNEAHVDGVIKSRVPARRVVVDCDRSLNRVHPVLDIHILPSPPSAVNHGVVKEEEGVTGRDEEITSGVTTDSEVTSGVHTEEAVGEVALHVRREPVEVVVVLDKRGNILILRPSLGGGLGDVTLEAARVVAQPRSGVLQNDRAEVNSPAIERSVSVFSNHETRC